MRKRKWPLGALFGSAILLLLLAWAILPLSDRVYSYTSGQNHVLVSEKRHVEMLPVSSWGFSKDTLIGCGNSESFWRRDLRLGCFIVTDTKKTTITQRK